MLHLFTESLLVADYSWVGVEFGRHLFALNIFCLCINSAMLPLPLTFSTSSATTFHNPCDSHSSTAAFGVQLTAAFLRGSPIYFIVRACLTLMPPIGGFVKDLQQCLVGRRYPYPFQHGYASSSRHRMFSASPLGIAVRS